MLNKIKRFLLNTNFTGFFVIALGILIAVTNIIPNDFWWHVKAGEYMTTTSSIPFTDVFSWYGIENSLYWHSHEWLFEIIIYLFSLIPNNYGVSIFVALCMGATFYIIFRFNKKSFTTNPLFSLLWLVTLSLVFKLFSSPRPHMVSFVLLSIILYILFEYRKNSNLKIIWTLPILSIIWANVHGGSSNLPYILSLMFAVTGLFDFKLGRLRFDKLSTKQLNTYSLITILCALATMVNPHGIDMTLYPYININDSLLLSTIAEWTSPDLKNTFGLIYILPIVVSFLTIAFSKRDILFIDLSLIGAFSYLTLQSVRFSSLLAIVASFILFKYLPFTLTSSKNKNLLYFTKHEKLKYKNTLNILFAAFGSLFLVTSILFVFSDKHSQLYSSDAINTETIEILQNIQPERMYNNYSYGGSLIYEGLKPLLDGRADMYSKNVYRDYINFTYHLDTKLIEDISFDYFVTPTNLTVENYLSTHPNQFELISDIKGVSIYKNLDYLGSQAASW